MSAHRSLVATLLLTATAASSTAAATEPSEEATRISEDSLFGAPSAGTPAAGSPATAAPAPGAPAASTSDEKKPAQHDAFAAGEVIDNPLQLGGIFYQRMIGTIRDGASLGDTALSFPLQFDAFMDVRPNDRLRGYVDGRLFFDAGRDSASNSTAGSGGSFQFSSTPSAPGTTPATQSNPSVALNEAWLKFDIERSIFVTVGRQHLKWGTSRFWNPTDFLNSQKRDPLLPYDLRLGNTMVKFEVPMEAKKANFTAIALLDNPTPVSTLGQLGLAMRAETLVGPAEIGVDLVFKGKRSPSFGVDFSAPIGQFDVYAEAGLLTGAPQTIYASNGPLVTGSELTAVYTATSPSTPLVQVSGGANYSFGWRDGRLATLGVEYFYNQAGNSSSSVYPILLYSGQFQPFYTGRNYGAFYLTAEGPDSGKHTSYTFSTLANLSDGSFISRLDFSWRALTYLTFEAYGAGHGGPAGGEFNFSLNTPAVTYNGLPLPPQTLAAALVDLGIGLRISF